jgi:hypothetical protein
VSVDYYTRLEKGHIAGVSDSVLNAVATALQLTVVEREYLLGLARNAPVSPAGSRVAGEERVVRDSVQQLLDAMTVPAIVQNPQQDVIAANLVGRAIYAPVFDMPGIPNLARFVYLDPRARDYWVDWELSRRTSAAILRFEAGRNPLNEQLTALIGELSTLSPYFRQDWARNDVHEHRTGTKAFRHPELGVVEVAFNVSRHPAPRARSSSPTARCPAATQRRSSHCSPAGRPATTTPNRAGNSLLEASKDNHAHRRHRRKRPYRHVPDPEARQSRPRGHQHQSRYEPRLCRAAGMATGAAGCRRPAT